MIVEGLMNLIERVSNIPGERQRIKLQKKSGQSLRLDTRKSAWLESLGVKEV